ncbi:MAG: hypothetical protein PHI97_19415 [Desulfobulbus sp.]|nr:hypothetical protein [Desulfobulbus sp.]
MSQALNSFPPLPTPEAQSSWRERNIQEVERLLAADRETVFKNPESFSAKLSLQSTENRLLELRNSSQIYLCADCGRETTGSTDDPGFGLCGRCESRLNSHGTILKQDTPTVMEGATVGAYVEALGRAWIIL